MEQSEADACYFRSKQLAKRVHEYVKEREVEFKQRERYNRYPRQLPPAEAVKAVLTDEQLDAFTAELLIKELGRTGSAQLALALLDLLTTDHISALSKQAFDAAISVCSTQYLAGEAVRVYGSLGDHGFTPDVHTCNLTIAACSQGGDVQSVLAILGDMQTRGVALNDFTALMALQACMFKRRGRHEEAILIVQQLLASGRMPSGEVCDAVLSVCEASMDKAPSLEAAQAAFEALAELNLHACTRAYNAILRACAKCGDWKSAQSYFDEMVAAGVPTSTHTFNSLITACLRGGALHNALAIFEWMVSGRRVGDDIQADIHTYNILIKACHQAGHLEKALEIMAWLEQSGVQFDNTTYEELIGVAEIAEIWDAKAIQDASRSALAVFPEHLRPAPYDAMRMTYLEHLTDLAEEEALAYAKLGGVSWVSTSLSKGVRMPTPPEASTSVFMAPKQRSWVASSPLVLSRMPSMKGDASVFRDPGFTVGKASQLVQGGAMDNTSPRPVMSPNSGRKGSIANVLPRERDSLTPGAEKQLTMQGSGSMSKQQPTLPALVRSPVQSADASATSTPAGLAARMSPAASTGRLSPAALRESDSRTVSVS